jgi:hypothetical protein
MDNIDRYEELTPDDEENTEGEEEDTIEGEEDEETLEGEEEEDN